MRAIYMAETEAVVAVSNNSTAKTVFGIKGDSGHGIDLSAYGFTIDQAAVAASDKAVLVEFCACTWGANAPGTNSTAVTVDNPAGPRITETFAAGRNWTTEPTTITVLQSDDCDPYKYRFAESFPLGETPDSAAAEGFCWRFTNPSGNAQSVNVRVWAKWGRV